jgi:CO/xanthine dehydrogenase FAD-binding subunit
MLLNPLTFHAPTTLKDVLSLYSQLEGVRIKAGGTFLLNSLKLLKRKGTKTPAHIISLSKVKELRGISADSNQMTIRAMTTISDLYDSAFLQDNFAVLREVCKNISTTPIRNMATVGGNLTCRYTWTEMPAVMVALEADLHFFGKDGKEESLSAGEFFKNNAKTEKILSHITLRRNKKSSVAYRRVKKTQFVDIPMLSVLMKTEFEGDRFTKTVVGVNNCVAFAQRDKILEEFLNQNKCSSTVAQEALEHLDKQIYDTRSSDYKMHMFRVSLKQAINELVSKRK